jgi:predicted kinase
MIIVMACGCPGCGKTTWIKSYIEDHPEEQCIHISRDEIRFGMVSEDEEYFSKEDEVFDEFIRQIQEAIDNKIEIIFVDATHISEGSRKKTLIRLKPFINQCQVFPVVFNTTEETCLLRNSYREGRRQVPDSAIKNMKKSMTDPVYDKFFKYSDILYVEEDGNEHWWIADN